MSLAVLSGFGLSGEVADRDLIQRIDRRLQMSAGDVQAFRQFDRNYALTACLSTVSLSPANLPKKPRAPTESEPIDSFGELIYSRL